MNMHEQLSLLEQLTVINDASNAAHIQSKISDIRSIINIIIQYFLEIDKIAQEIELATSTSLGFDEIILSAENNDFVKSSIDMIRNLLKKANKKNYI